MRKPVYLVPVDFSQPFERAPDRALDRLLLGTSPNGRFDMPSVRF
jgi:hypothetical protein